MCTGLWTVVVPSQKILRHGKMGTAWFWGSCIKIWVTSSSDVPDVDKQCLVLWTFRDALYHSLRYRYDFLFTLSLALSSQGKLWGFPGWARSMKVYQKIIWQYHAYGRRIHAKGVSYIFQPHRWYGKEQMHNAVLIKILTLLWFEFDPVSIISSLWVQCTVHIRVPLRDLKGEIVHILCKYLHHCK